MRELVRIHGGDVDVESVVGQGTTFTVTLPRAEAARPTASAPAILPTASAVPYLEEAGRWLGDPTTPDGPPTDPTADRRFEREARLLVVDDNADMRQYLGQLFGEFWQVDHAGNGREALRVIADRRPDLIVTDVMMPEVDGVELLRQVRADAGTRLIPVIMLSARSGEEARIEGLAAGADDYVVKPFAAKELIARVRTHLELSRLRQETALQNERLLTFINVAPAALAVVRGPEHVFELANDRYCQLVGRRDIVGKPGREALPELVAQGIWDLFDRTYASGQAYVAHEFRAELDRLGSGDLDEGIFNVVLQPLKDLRGASEGILVHAVETTYEAHARRDVDAARRAAEAANRAKDEFLAMLGHELRNPLAPILTALQLMNLRGDRGAEKERAVIDRQVRHVVRLVDDLLDVSRIARGKIALKRERVELANALTQAVEMASPLIEQKRLALEIDVAPEGLAVDADHLRLRQIVFNLLHNAAKYTEPEGRVSVKASRRDDTIELRIRDTGVGIAPEMLPHVFDLFSQGRQALDRAQGGLGLGLAIVRNLVELHGGAVSASSGGAGQGSEFVVTLPASRQQLVERTADVAPRRTRTADGDSTRVLVVDDNDDAAALLAEALQLAGFHTRTAGDGPAALRLADSLAPDVAVLDLGLPLMDGYELGARLRQRERPPTLIAVTGYGAKSDQRRTRTAGFDLHLVKPIDVMELIDRLRRLEARRVSNQG